MTEQSKAKLSDTLIITLILATTGLIAVYFIQVLMSWSALG